MSKIPKEKNLNYGMFSPKFESSRRLKLGKEKIKNSKYFQAILGSPTNFNSHIKYPKNKSTYFSPDYTNSLLSPIHKNRPKLKKCSSQKNMTERPTSVTSRSFPTVMNNFRVIKSPIYKTTGNNSILYNTSTENKSKYFNLETEKLYQETRQIKKLVKYLTKELLVLKKENEEKDRQITVKEKQINDIIIKNNSLLLGTANIETNEINKINENSTNSSFISNNNNISNNKTEDNSNIFNDSIYINALSSNRNSSTGNLFFRIKKEIKHTNNEMKLENDKFEKLKRSVYVTKMNELNIESIILKTNLKKINSLLENALVIKRSNDLKNEELTKIKENLEKQEKIENNLNTMILNLEKKENELKDKLEMNEFNLINKIKEVNLNINELVALKKKNENLNNDKVIKSEIYTTINKNNGNPVQINSIYKNKIKELKKSIKFYERQIKYSEDELNKLKEKRKKLIETEKIKGLKLNIDINNKEKEEIKIVKKEKEENNKKKDLLTDEEKIKNLKEILKRAKDSEKKMEEKMEKYGNKLRELEIIEEEKQREKEEMNNQNQSQIEFGIDSENPFYTEEENNFPEISLKFTSSQFNQFTYVLFKNFEAKGIVEEESKNKITNPFSDYMKNNNITIIEYNSPKFKEVMDEFTKIIMDSLKSTNTYNYTLINVFISALFFNSECDINKLIKYFNILFSYTKNYSIEEEKYLKKLKTKYLTQTKKLINCIKNFIISEESDNKEYFPLLKMKEILDKNEINLKDKYIEFLFYYLKKFEDPESKLSDLKFELLKNILKEEKEKEKIEEENSENNNLNFPIKDSEIKDNSYKNEEDIAINTSKKEDSNILDILDKRSNINLTSQKNEMKSPTEEDFSKRQKRKKKSMDKKSQKKEKKEDKENSDDFEEEEDSMTEITNEEYIKQLSEALKIMQNGIKEKGTTFEELMSNVVQKRKITGIFYECISIEDFNEQFKSLNIILSDLKLSCLCSKYSIPNELRLIDKNKIEKDLEKQAKGILKFNEEDEDDEENFN